MNTDIYDTSEKARPPAWTDRILYRGKGIYQIAYRSHMDLKMSDHKPVSALFKSEISVVDQTKYRKVHEDILKKMDKHENEFLPQVTVDQTEVIYDLVKFREPQTREIIIANTGVVSRICKGVILNHPVFIFINKTNIVFALGAR